MSSVRNSHRSWGGPLGASNQLPDDRVRLSRSEDFVAQVGVVFLCPGSAGSAGPRSGCGAGALRRSTPDLRRSPGKKSKVGPTEVKEGPELGSPLVRLFLIDWTRNSGQYWTRGFLGALQTTIR